MSNFILPIDQQMTYMFQAEFGTYTILAAFVFGFILSFAVGANDSANSWGTPVGAKTVTLGVAFLLGSICEAAGSIFLSKNVIDGISGNTSIVRMRVIYERENSDVRTRYKYGSKSDLAISSNRAWLASKWNAHYHISLTGVYIS